MTVHATRPQLPSNPAVPGVLRRTTGAVARRLHLPGMAAVPECASIRYWERATGPSHDDGRSPVLLVHGYAGTEHVFGPLRAALTDAGFGCVVALRYNAFRTDVAQVADWLVDQACRSMEANGSATVHLVGHSLGGLVVRHAVQRRGLAGLASTVVTIATPHAGTILAHFVPGPAARQMRPGSDFLADLAGDPADHRTRWIAIHGDDDRVVRESANGFGHPGAAPVTVNQPASGHRSVARHPEVVSYIVDELRTADELRSIDHRRNVDELRRISQLRGVAELRGVDEWRSAEHQASKAFSPAAVCASQHRAARITGHLFAGVSGPTVSRRTPSRPSAPFRSACAPS